MKVTAVKLKTAALTALLAGSITGFAQTQKIMYVMKNGEVVFSSPVSDVDNVSFDKAASDSALIIFKNDGSLSDKILLNDIQQLSFLDDGLSVETSSGNETIAFDDIAKLVFGKMNNTGIDNSQVQSDLNVLVYLTPDDEIKVESTSAVKSLTLLGVDGKIISVKHLNGKEMHGKLSLHGKPVGVYLLRVETEQNTVVKKIIKQKSR